MFINSIETVVVKFLYRNPADLIPSEIIGRKSKLKTLVTSVTAVVREKKVNTEVLSVNVYKDESSITRLDEPATFEFYPKEIGYNPVCSYMKYADKTGVWDTEGCLYEELPLDKDQSPYDAKIVCKCDHLTNFAVVMTMGKRPIVST
ncbi:adhesion G protein-coupled receptor L3-like [Glandiceps talaboti]